MLSYPRKARSIATVDRAGAPRRFIASIVVATTAALSPASRLCAQSLSPADFGTRIRAVASGTTTSLDRFRGRPVVINVWASWCAPCVSELGSLAGLSDAVGSEVAFVLVSPESLERVARFTKARRLDPSHFYVEIDRIPDALDVRAVPTTIVLDRRGAIVLHRRGAAEWNTPGMRALLATLGSEAVR